MTAGGAAGAATGEGLWSRAVTDLRRFIEEQEQLARVERVTEPLEARDEAARALAAREGRIVVLENVVGYETPVVSGVAGSRELLAAALGVEPGEAVRALADRMERPGEVKKVSSAPFLANVVERPEVDRVVPLLTFDPGADRPYTSSSVFAARSTRHGMNLSFHRMMYLGGDRFSVRVVPRHLRMILDEGGGKARVAVVMGLHPAVSLAAATSGGPELDELRLAASYLGAPLEVYDLDGLLVPAGAELVLEGELTGELAEEGPFVDLTGTLDGVRQQPVLRVDRLYHRDGLLYHVVLPGGAEHRLLMGTPQEPRILRAVSNTFSGVQDVALSAGGCCWLHGVVSIRAPLAGQAVNVGLAALGAHPSMKRVVVVDDDVDVHDAEQVEWAIATRVQPDRDIVIVPGARGSSLDPSRDQAGSTTGKWIVDATIPAGARREEFALAAPERLPRESRQ